MRWLSLISILFAFPLVVEGQDSWEDFKDGQTIKSIKGLNFSVPEDRPIEKKHGIVMLMPLDEYIALKFSKLEIRLKKIEETIKRTEEKLSFMEESIDLLDKKEIFLESLP